MTWKIKNKYGKAFYATLSRDLKHEMPSVEGFSETSIRYAKRFYTLYNEWIENLHQLVEDSSANLPQVGEDLTKRIFSIPWGHHKLLIDKFSDVPHVAWFYVNQTIENGRSRALVVTIRQ